MSAPVSAHIETRVMLVVFLASAISLCEHNLFMSISQIHLIKIVIYTQKQRSLWRLLKISLF